MKESDSFWADIKNLEEQLAKSPDSFCFARLSDVYIKVGLVDDALHVARQGVMKHPDYLSGQRVLSLACHAKGLNDEALAALQQVTKAIPEDVSSQKLLGRLYAETGNHDAACRAFRTALEFTPDDVECRIELESLERSTRIIGSVPETGEDDEGIIEDLEMLEELDILEEDQPESEFLYEEAPPPLETVPTQHHDPLSTSTLAELYVSQGFIQKALEIYRAILTDNPEDRSIAGRIADLEALEAASEPEPDIEDTFEEEAEDESAFSIPPEATFQEAEPIALQVPSLGVADNALTMLDGWLENIRRIKSCR